MSGNSIMSRTHVFQQHKRFKERPESKIVKVKNQSHVDNDLRCEWHYPQRVLATKSDNQLANLQGPAANASFSERKETRVVAGQNVAASSWQCTCPQHPEYQAVLRHEEYRRPRTTSPFTWFCSCDFFFFSLSSRGSSKKPVLKTWRQSRGL